MEEKTLTLVQEEQIRKKALEIKAEKKLRTVYPMVVLSLIHIYLDDCFLGALVLSPLAYNPLRDLG